MTLNPINRHRSTITRVPFTNRYQAGSNLYLTPGEYAWEDVIDDVKTPRGYRLARYTAENAVYQEREFHSVSPWVSGYKIDKNTGSPYYPYWCCEYYTMGDAGPLPGINVYRDMVGDIWTPDPSISDFLSKATNPNGNNIVVDLAELLLAGGFIKGIAEMFSPGQILRLAKEVAEMSKRGIKDSAISVHLQAIYGYLPFWESLKTLIFSLAQFEIWADNLVAVKDVPVVIARRWDDTKALTYKKGPYAGSQTVLTASGSATIHCVRRFHATLTLNKSSLSPIERLMLFLDFVDLSIDASDLWAVAPLSFVVDWFLPISDFLKDFDTFASRDLWSLTNTYASEEIEFTSTYSNYRHYDQWGYYPGVNGRWYSNMRRYQRFNWEPRTVSTKGLSLPEGWQWVSLAELAALLLI